MIYGSPCQVVPQEVGSTAYFRGTGLESPAIGDEVTMYNKTTYVPYPDGVYNYLSNTNGEGILILDGVMTKFGDCR